MTLMRHALRISPVILYSNTNKFILLYVWKIVHDDVSRVKGQIHEGII